MERKQDYEVSGNKKQKTVSGDSGRKQYKESVRCRYAGNSKPVINCTSLAGSSNSNKLYKKQRQRVKKQQPYLTHSTPVYIFIMSVTNND